ncbi:stage II sporulation protein P [Qingrenia yutianensis]|uniref:Stage II sporulation protein P n=1 Tax=Qingrenia yutianensis TaxID=2763676 RepID=A0A926FBS0_9FIRM|nr:stage II sporulation protein P [Qingrenia yutianensis]MBC8595564.1 stage II sporulation protein P [Qingrenia yutianensis]
MKYRYAKKAQSLKITGIYASVFLFLTIFILNFPALHFNFDIQKSALSSAVVNMPKSNGSVAVKSAAAAVKYVCGRYFSQESFLRDAFPYIEAKKTPEIKVTDTPPSATSENENSVQKPNIKETKMVSKNLQIKNETDYKIDVQSLLSEKPAFTKTDGQPLVLIMHTHSSEAYESNGEYQTSDTDRTQDANYNVIKVGDKLTEMLEDKGISVIHDKTVHDYPSYTHSYKKSLETIERNLKEHPSIKIVFDVHRDALGDAQNKVKFTADINGEKAAQAMLVCGTNSMGLWFDNWEDNLRFAMQIQDRLERCYPGLARPVNIRRERFNLHATRGSVLIEVGTNGNTLDEALVCAKYLGDTLADVINDLTILQ